MRGIVSSRRQDPREKLVLCFPVVLFSLVRVRDLQEIILAESLRIQNEVVAEKEKEVQIGAFHHDLDSYRQFIR